VLLYILFFIAAKNIALRLETVAMASIAGFLLLAVDDNLGRGVSMFYMGGLACYLVDAIGARKVPRSLVGVIAIVAISALLIAKLLERRGNVGTFFMVFGFPALIVTLACLERRIERWVHPFRFLGNISYSTYLLHVPIFLVIVLTGFANNPSSRIFFLVVMVTTFSLSLASFHFFEFPVQQFLRHLLLSRRVAALKSAATD
jgi:peptidoglycan/LPS O-acetylase OafA/YrhL